jgi:hypothetical protein
MDDAEGLLDTDSGLDSNAARGDRETWSDADAGDDVFRPPVFKRGGLTRVPAKFLYATKFRGGPALRAPLKLEISPTDDLGFDLYSPALNLGGVGETMDAAFADLEGTVLGLWEEYRATAYDRMTEDALALFGKLRTLFVA